MQATCSRDNNITTSQVTTSQGKVSSTSKYPGLKHTGGGRRREGREGREKGGERSSGISAQGTQSNARYPHNASHQLEAGWVVQTKQQAPTCDTLTGCEHLNRVWWGRVIVTNTREVYYSPERLTIHQPGDWYIPGTQDGG